MFETFAIIKILFLLTFSFLFAMACTPAMTHFLYKYKLGKSIRDEGTAPIFYKMHAKKSGTPTMGGIIIWGTTLAIGFLFFAINIFFPESFAGKMNFISRGQTLLPLGALVVSAIVGLVDDYFNIKKIGPNGGGLRMRHRLYIYSAIAAAGALWFRYKLDWDLIHIAFVGDFNIGILYVPVFIAVIVATAFSVNQTDGLDGLAGGTLLTSFGAFGFISLLQGRIDLAVLCAVIVGALLAFLWFNINPARFFMGDTGAMPLGVTLGIVAMLTNTVSFLPIIGFVFVVEAVSTIMQMMSKRLRGKKIFLSAPIHHHFEAIGWPEPKIVMRSWVISMVAAGVGLALFLLDKGLN